MCIMKNRANGDREAFSTSLALPVLTTVIVMMTYFMAFKVRRYWLTISPTH